MVFNAISSTTARRLLQFADANGNGQVGIGELDRASAILDYEARNTTDFGRAQKFFNYVDALNDLADGLYYNTLDGDVNKDDRLSIKGSTSEFERMLKRNSANTFSYGDLFQNSIFENLFGDAGFGGFGA